MYDFTIMPNNYWPKVQRGTEVVRFKADPIICWLAKYFPILPYVEAEYPRMVDADPIFDSSRGVLICSHAQAQAIKEKLKETINGTR